MADESYMEQIFMNLYRITDELQSRGRKYSYLIVREEGNLLLICRRALVSNHFEKIDQLGGVETQFVYHSHDAPGTHIDEVHSRFGSKLYYHQAEREEIREKTQCPGVEFGDEGLQLGSDFHALFFPGHTPGHTIFRWQSGGKHYWFISHVVGRNGAKWDVGFNPAKAAPRTTIPKLSRVAN